MPLPDAIEMRQDTLDVADDMEVEGAIRPDPSHLLRIAGCVAMNVFGVCRRDDDRCPAIRRGHIRRWRQELDREALPIERVALDLLDRKAEGGRRVGRDRSDIRASS